MSPLADVALALAEPPADEVARVRAWLAAVADAAARIAPIHRAWLLVTPLGWPERARLGGALASLGVAVEARAPIPRFAPVSTALQARGGDAAGLRRAAIFEAAWEALFPGAPAEAWALAPADHARAAAAKRAIRAGLPNLRVVLGAGERPAHLHAFHLADPGDEAVEARRLAAALALLGARERGGDRPPPPASRA